MVFITYIFQHISASRKFFVMRVGSGVFMRAAPLRDLVNNYVKQNAYSWTFFFSILRKIISALVLKRFQQIICKQPDTVLKLNMNTCIRTFWSSFNSTLILETYVDFWNCCFSVTKRQVRRRKWLLISQWIEFYTHNNYVCTQMKYEIIIKSFTQKKQHKTYAIHCLNCANNRILCFSYELKYFNFISKFSN